MVYHSRFEDRTREEFVSDIKKKTKNEIPYTYDWFCKHGEKHFDGPLKLIYTGVGWDGDFIEDGAADFSKSDFLIETKTSVVNIEFKDNEHFERYNFSTFKISSLKNCIKNNAYILSPTGSDYILISPTQQTTILDNVRNNLLPAQIYWGFCKTKVAVRLYKNHSNEYDRIDTYTKIHKGK